MLDLNEIDRQSITKLEDLIMLMLHADMTTAGRSLQNLIKRMRETGGRLDRGKSALLALPTAPLQQKAVRAYTNLSFSVFSSVLTFFLLQENASCLLDFSPQDIAQQLTLIEQVLFMAIKPDELVNQYVKGEEQAKCAESVLQFLKRENHVRQWVITDILMQPTSTDSVNHIKRWIEIAHVCMELQNFNTMVCLPPL